MPGFNIKEQVGYDLTTAEKTTLESISGLGDPGADRILFWDESANDWAFLTAGTGLTITGTTITAEGTGDVVGPASATDNAIVRFNLTTGKLIQDSSVIIDDNGAMQMPNSQWFSFKDFAGTGALNALKGNTDDEVDVGVQLNIGSLELEQDAGVVTLVDMPVSSASADGTEMSYTMKIDGNNILKVYAEADGAGGADSFAVKILNSAGLDITETAATTDTDKFLVSDSNRVKYRTGAEVKADIDLGNVENTALSTWAGSSNITTLGTIGTGVWNGTAIGDTYISSASAWNAKMDDLIDDTTPELGGELDCGAHSIGFTQQTATGDGTTTIDWKLGNKFKFTFGAQAETFTFTAPSNPCNLVLMMVQDGTGSRTATWPATVKWAGGTAPTLTTAGNGVDIISFYYDGSYYHGVASLAFAVPA